MRLAGKSFFFFCAPMIDPCAKIDTLCLLWFSFGTCDVRQTSARDNNYPLISDYHFWERKKPKKL